MDQGWLNCVGGVKGKQGGEEKASMDSSLGDYTSPYKFSVISLHHR